MSKKYNDKNEKTSGIIEDSLIIYNIKNQFSQKQINDMEKGYKYMAKLNLEYSHLGDEYMLDDIGEYEAWICGV